MTTCFTGRDTFRSVKAGEKQKHVKFSSEMRLCLAVMCPPLEETRKHTNTG